MTIERFKKIIWENYRRAGRLALPWRNTHDPYAIFVSEIMLQQTQVNRVAGYYKFFLERFPDFSSLAKANVVEVLTVWQGLGYNRRALFLKRSAEMVVEKFDGRLPPDRAALESLHGIGKGTSGSLMAFAFNKPEIFIETNIRRVFLHFFFEGKKKVTDEEIERYIEKSVDRKDPREWYWALMDYGTLLGAQAKEKNPNRRSAHYKKQAAFSGSDRELRGKIVRSLLLKKSKIDERTLLTGVGASKEKFEKVIKGLYKEGFVIKEGNYLYINGRTNHKNAAKSR
jgi:A/G-specific adenine glycosylase